MDEIRGLAWDDKPEEYMSRLRRRLKPLHIGLEVEEDHGRFLERFDAEYFDFAVLDLFDDSGSADSEKGTILAQHISNAMRDKPWYPIFVITGFLERLKGGHFDHLPSGALLRYKADEVFIAKLIQEDLKRRGVLVSRRKVFMIRSAADTFAEELERWLSEPPRQISVETVKPANSTAELLSVLKSKMSECAGIVAVCAKDRELSAGEWRTRPNVTLEIGMALSLPRGIERLIVLKEKGVERPTDLGGLLTLEYDVSPLERPNELEQRLRMVGVELNG